MLDFQKIAQLATKVVQLIDAEAEQSKIGPKALTRYIDGTLELVRSEFWERKLADDQVTFAQVAAKASLETKKGTK